LPVAEAKDSWENEVARARKKVQRGQNPEQVAEIGAIA
jgi:hypothetical protein